MKYVQSMKEDLNILEFNALTTFLVCLFEMLRFEVDFLLGQLIIEYPLAGSENTEYQSNHPMDNCDFVMFF